MSDELPRRRSPLWIMSCMVLVAWVACGVYRRQVPPLTTARAVLQVPSATDLGTLCLRPDIFQAAVEHLESEGDIFITFEQQAGKPRLSGKLIATKMKVAPPASGTNPATSTSQISTETWELTYRSPNPERALGELSALITVLQHRVAPTTTVKSPTDDRVDTQLTQLEAKQYALQQELEKLDSEADADLADPVRLATMRDRVQSLQRALTESQVQRLQSEEEWRLVEQDIELQQRLDATVAKLSAGPVQEAVLHIEKQRKLSAELTRLNETERRLGNVYGDKHPKLIDLRQKFDQILSELGGWDHVLDEGHVAERLQASLEQLLKLKQQHETDLETQLELEKQELSAFNQSTERRTALTAQLEQLGQEVAKTRLSTSAG
ncbi:MAG: hypothetical protein JWN70_3424, partial [Planctomycetaceae bacterium]|nr:hypothetical protein [Planctomycetaceae bacterium]